MMIKHRGFSPTSFSFILAISIISELAIRKKTIFMLNGHINVVFRKHSFFTCGLLDYSLHLQRLQFPRLLVTTCKRIHSVLKDKLLTFNMMRTNVIFSSDIPLIIFNCWSVRVWINAHFFLLIRVPVVSRQRLVCFGMQVKQLYVVDTTFPWKRGGWNKFNTVPNRRLSFHKLIHNLCILPSWIFRRFLTSFSPFYSLVNIGIFHKLVSYWNRVFGPVYCLPNRLPLTLILRRSRYPTTVSVLCLNWLKFVDRNAGSVLFLRIHFFSICFNAYRHGRLRFYMVMTCTDRVDNAADMRVLWGGKLLESDSRSAGCVSRFDSPWLASI